MSLSRVRNFRTTRGATASALLMRRMRKGEALLRERELRLSHNELELERLERLYSALSHINQAIVRTSNQDELFQRVCEGLVEKGHFRMAWIGWEDPATHRLMPVGSAGDTDGYLSNVSIYTDDRSEGRGPSGTAFRTEQPYICNDMLADPMLAPWRKEAERRGYRASAVFPFRLHGKVCGTLNVYAAMKDYFQDREIALLAEAAVDLSFALDTLAQRAERERAERLAEREQRFASVLIEAMPGIFYLYNEHMRFLRWNHDFELASGYSASELAQLSPIDLFAGADRMLIRQRIEEVFAYGQADVEAELLAKDGSLKPYYFTGKRIELDGETCLVGVGVDISTRKRAEAALKKSEERYRSTLDSILEGCQLLDFDLRYLYLNGAAAIHNRRPNEELLGKTMSEAWPGIEASHVYAMLKRCLTARLALHEETEFQFPDGSTGWFDVRAQPVPEGIFVLSIDISERKRAELALHELNDQLEHKVQERTTDLETARVRAESADKLKSAFLATMSHELRTPLNSILGFTGIILQGLAGPLNAEQTKQLGMVQGSARHLLELINDVLDISKIEAGQLDVHLAPFDLRTSIQRVFESVKPHAERKGLALHLDVQGAPDGLTSDRRRVEQILLNLLNNAIKFTDRGSVALTLDTRKVELRSGQGFEAAVRIQVADTGIGMKPQDMRELFQPFRQIDSGLERQHEGTGLGLAICRRLTELLGGSISVQSEPGRGSVFTIILPLQHRRGMS